MWGGGKVCVVGEKRGLAFCLWPTVKLFSEPCWCVPLNRKTGGEQEAKSHWNLFRKLSGCSNLAELKGRQRRALFLSDKCTSSIDCKVYWWGGTQDPATMAVFLFDTLNLNLLA